MKTRHNYAVNNKQGVTSPQTKNKKRKKQMNKKTTKKTAKKNAAKKVAKKTHVVRCCLCGAKLEGRGNNPAPLAAEGVCCDECNAAKVLPARMAAAKAEERRAKAAEYYKAHGDKLREASRRSHAKRRAEIAAAASNLKAIFDAVCGLVSETGAEEFDHFYKKGGEAMMNDFENAVRAICRGR